MRNLAISTSVRPGRVAVFVDANDDHWQGTCLRIIEYFTRMWGGCGNIIVPTDGKTISPLFWRILERFDADYLQAYRRTLSDLELEQPHEFEELYQKELAAWEKQIGEKSHPFAAKELREDLSRLATTTFSISQELQQELKTRLAPFYFQEHIVEAGTVTATTTPHHPQTDIVDILPHGEHPNRVLKLAVNPAVIPPLWWASCFGSLNAEMETKFGGMNIGVLNYGSTPDEIRQLIGLAIQGYEEIYSQSFLTNTSVDILQQLLEAFPLRFSMMGLGFYRSTLAHDWEEPVIAVAGNTVHDFALYYSLSRMRPLVFWVLPSIAEDALAENPPKPAVDEKFQFANALNRASREAQRSSALNFVSVTLNDSQLKRIAERVREAAMIGVNAGVPANAMDCVPDYPVRHFEKNNASAIRSVAVPDDDVIPFFDTPLPKNFKVNPSKHRWLTEIGILKHHLPRHCALGAWLMGGPYFTTKDVRVSAEGPTYFCPSNFILSGMSAEQSVPRPSIKVPEPMELFAQIARHGGLSCAVSDKGSYAETACRKFGGLAEITEFLKSKTGQQLTAVYLDTDEPTKGDHLHGVVLEGRRYLDLESLQTTLQNEDEAANILDRLSTSGILYRGFVLKCQHCRRADWFAFRDLSDTFICKRCHREQIFTRQHWLYPKQPRVYYQLDEMVYQGLQHNMQVPLLTLDYLRRNARDSFLFVPELQYRASDATAGGCEADLNCVVDGVLTIGEAKKENRLEETEKKESAIIEKYAQLAKKLSAHQLVFATGSEQWHASTKTNLEKAFKDDQMRLTFLTGKELYS